MRIASYILTTILLVGSAHLWLGELPVSQLLPPKNITQHEWITMQFEVTAYCPCELCCGPHADRVTASGMSVDGPVKHWIAAPAHYPFGTVMRVPGYGQGQPVCVMDRGGAITGDRLDVYFSTHEAAIEFGRRTLSVQIWRNR